MKKNILLIIVAIGLLFLCACNQNADTEMPETTQTPTSSVGSTSDITVQPTILPNTSSEAPSAEPTSVGILDQIFVSPGVYDEHKKIHTSLRLLTYPIDDNGIYCSRAFFIMACYLYGEDSVKYSEDFENENYEYTFALYYFESGKQINSVEDYRGPYIVSPFKVVTQPTATSLTTIYTFSLSDSPGGLFVADFEDEKEYTFILCVLKDDIVIEYSTDTIRWSPGLLHYLDWELYRRFWETRDRSEGFLSGMHPKTEKDLQDEVELGFEDGPLEWNG